MVVFVEQLSLVEADGISSTRKSSLQQLKNMAFQLSLALHFRRIE
jgi:hypothetical protein